MNRTEQLKEQFKIYRTSNEPYKRFGSDNDGGYVMIDDLKSTDYVISCGIGDGNIFLADAAVEKDMAENVAGVDMYDIADVDISGMSDKLKFYQREIGSSFSLSEMIDLAGNHDDYILKMDVEGGEWPAFLSAKSEDIAKFRQMVIEFHDIATHTLNNEGLKNIISVLDKINKTHKLVLVHPNNYAPTLTVDLKKIPQVVEVLFIRKDSYRFMDVDYPESLTSPCNPNFEDLDLFYN